jgi:hypothetical protein
MDNTDVDLDDDNLPGDDAPPEAELFQAPAEVPEDEGNADAERKEDTDG